MQDMEKIFIWESTRVPCVGYVLYYMLYVLYFRPTYFGQFWADILLPARHISGTTYFRDHMILGGFRHMVSVDGFLFPVKELGFWMPLAPICILYCKQCNKKVYQYNICWFSRFGFPGEKSLCNVCIFHCIFSVLF